MAEEERSIRLEVVTPTAQVFDGVVESVTAPGVLGEFGVLPRHRPMLSATRSGLVRFVKEGRTEVLVVGPGFAEVEPDHVILLTDRCVKAADIDADRARKEFEALEARYKDFRGDTTTTEFQELERDVQWAEASLEGSRS
jgi:F-type H+-transporting ATPase subunit epsilon